MRYRWDVTSRSDNPNDNPSTEERGFPLSIKFTASDLDRLDVVARYLGRSRSEVARALVRLGFERVEAIPPTLFPLTSAASGQPARFERLVLAPLEPVAGE